MTLLTGWESSPRILRHARPHEPGSNTFRALHSQSGKAGFTRLPLSESSQSYTAA